MPQIDLHRIFLESASEVLETMFFTGVADDNSPEDAAALISAELRFRGSPSGRFGLRMPLATGRMIAASFLGLDASELLDHQVADVVCELNNMFCGSVLSRLEAGARFELMHPEIDAENHDWHANPGAVGYTFGIEEGTVTLWISFEECAGSQQPAVSHRFSALPANSAKGTDACPGTERATRRSLRGTPDTLPVLRGFLNS